MLRVVLVDDSATMRAVASAYLAADERIEVVGLFPSAATGLEGVRAACPDVVVLDEQMRGGDGLDVLPALVQACPTARVVMFTSSPDIEPEARARGAAACVDKASPLDVLLSAVLG